MEKKEIIFGLAVAICLVLLISPFASPWPDGLEKVAEDKGFLEKGEGDPIFASPIPDYKWPGLKNPVLATSVAGVFGTVLLFIFVYALAIVIGRKT